MPGTTDIGNHGDDTVTTIALPFSYTLYDQTFTNINLSSNGNAQFTTTDTTFTNQCLPWTAHNYTIFPYWDDLYLVNSGFGIFTSISGTAPNRIFNIEWRAQYFPGSGSAGFELRLYEGQTRFDVIYGTVTAATHRPQPECRRTTPPLTSTSATARAVPATGGQSYILTPCGTPTPTPTASPSASATATASASATATATATATAPSPTPTGSPSCTPNYIFTVGTGTIVPGATDTGNHLDDGTTVISLPFSYSSMVKASQGPTSPPTATWQFVSNSTSVDECLSAAFGHLQHADHAALGRPAHRPGRHGMHGLRRRGLRYFHLTIGHCSQPYFQRRVADDLFWQPMPRGAQL